MTSNSPKQRLLQESYFGLRSILRELMRVHTANFGFRSALRGMDSYRRTAEDLQHLRARSAEILTEICAARKELQIGKGRSEVWTLITGFAQTLVDFSGQLRELCERAWRVRALDEEWPKDEYRRALRRMTDTKIKLKVLHPRLVDRLETEGIIHRTTEVRWLWVFAVSVVVISGSYWIWGATDGFFKDGLLGSLLSLGCLVVFVAGGLLVAFLAGVRQDFG